MDEKSWKLPLGEGVRASSRCTGAIGDATAVMMAITEAKARRHLATDFLVRRDANEQSYIQ